MKKLFRNRSFSLLFAGALVSSIGTTLFGFAAGLYVQDLFPKEIYDNQGAFYFSIVAASGIFVRVIFSPIAGAFVDKWNRVRVIYITDFIRGLLFFGTLFILSMGLTNYETLYLFIVVTVIAGLNQAFFSPAVGSALPEIVGEDMLQAANGIQSMVGSIQTIFGVIAGMLLYELVGIEMAIILNAVSFILSGISEMFIKTKFVRPSELEEDDDFTIVENIKFGFSYLKKKEGLLNMMMFSLMLNLAFSPLFSIGIPFMFKTELGKNAYHLGGTDLVFSLSMLIAGPVIGSMVIKKLSSIVRKGLLFMVGTFVVTSLLIVLQTYGIIGYWVFYGGFLICMVAFAWAMLLTNVPLNTGMVKAVDPKVRGRVFGMISSLSAGAIPISMLIAGKIIEYSNVAILSIVCTLILLIPLYGFLNSKSVKTLIDGFEEANNGISQKQEEIQQAV